MLIYTEIRKYSISPSKDWLDWLNGFYVTFQLIYGYIETDDDNDDDNTETWSPKELRENQ